MNTLASSLKETRMVKALRIAYKSGVLFGLVSGFVEDSKEEK